ncbi:PREDICTED: leucine-rich repeat-containing protein 26 [Gavialis gangeticus]|uniref:leucine-rich repeat-containing protein 26 n=1 Tax=Gavialis gangeticus TaxID=94835 RepID=UPI00092FC835|nr:PREDICTED: leucine-rich repeat-containing protein 26 [Gavialis gangeticus]
MASLSCRGALLTSLLLLYPLLCAACPAVCSCSSGEVDCRDHALHFVPSGLPTNASAVLLGYNRIAGLKAHTFLQQVSLLYLSLHDNVLVSIHSQALAGLGVLQELDLSNNYLVVLTAETFLPLSSLTTLNVGNNQLAQLTPDVPRTLPRLQALFLHNNALRFLDTGFFENLPAVHLLTLGGNPWACSCAIWPLFFWLTHNRDKIQEVNLTLCRFPELLNQFPIAALDNASFSRCQESPLHPHNYTFFLLIGPASFLGSIIICILTGCLVVACNKLSKDPYPRQRALRPRMTPPQQ